MFSFYLKTQPLYLILQNIVKIFADLSLSLPLKSPLFNPLNPLSPASKNLAVSRMGNLGKCKGKMRDIYLLSSQ